MGKYIGATGLAYLWGKIKTLVAGKANTSDLATVATSGSYNDLSNTPTIPTVPTNVSAFVNDAGYLTSHQDISGKEDKIGITAGSGTSLTASANTYYRFASAVGTLAVTLPVPSDTTHLSTVILCFTTGSSTAVTFTSSATIKYKDGYAIEASTMYEVNALYNGSEWIIMSTKIATS